MYQKCYINKLSFTMLFLSINVFGVIFFKSLQYFVKLRSNFNYFIKAKEVYTY